jgi:hypothetical protein
MSNYLKCIFENEIMKTIIKTQLRISYVNIRRSRKCHVASYLRTNVRKLAVSWRRYVAAIGFVD